MGEAVFERDGSLVTVVLDGQPQSAVDLDDPTRLDFEYVQHFALVIDALAPSGPLRVTHVGGAGLTLARWVNHLRDGSPQIVLEPDAVLTDAVRRELPLPRGHRIRVRPVDGLTGIGAVRDASADVVVLDAYAGGQVPAELGTVEWFAELRRVLAPGGLVLANVADEPGMRYAARVAAGAREALGHVAFVGAARGAEGQALRQPRPRRGDHPTRPLHAAPRHGIRRTAHRGDGLGGGRSAAAGGTAVQRGRG